MILRQSTAALRDIAAANKDMSNEDASSHFGRSANGAPMALYRMIVAAVYVIVAITQLMAL